MVSRLFYRWERRLASVDNNRVVRPFTWGEDWVASNGDSAGASADARVRDYVRRALEDPDAYFAVDPAREVGTAPLPADARPGERLLTFPSAVRTPHPENDVVHLRYFPERKTPNGAPRRGVVVLPQWNADEGGHVGLCRLLNTVGLGAVRLSLPYHDRRMPPGFERADPIVSSNVGQTLQVCRQAVLDARRAVMWMHEQGYDRIGLLGTSLGSCLSMLTHCFEPLVKASALNHVSPWFADVVWEGMSTRHVREGLEMGIELDDLRSLWAPISPQTHIARVGDRPTLLVYALYDYSFPLHLSKDIVRLYRSHGWPTSVRVLPCGHYTTGKAPFKFIDGYYLAKFLHGAL